MSQFRTPEISRAFLDWANSGRYSPPKEIRSNEKAQQVEAEALISVLLKHAPHRDYMSWITGLLDQLEYSLKFRVWPTKKELDDACFQHRRSMPNSAMAGLEIDNSPVAIVERKMQANEPVGESWLYGANASQIIQRNIVSIETVESYRRAAYLARERAYGRNFADSWLVDMIRRHDLANGIFPTTPQPTTQASTV